MRLGEALTLRARQAGKLAELRTRVVANLSTQEGDTPAENANELMVEHAVLSQQQADLIERINRTNVEAGLAKLLLERDHTRRVAALVRQAAASAVQSANMAGRYMRTELRIVTHVDVSRLNTEADELDEEVRRIDAQLQQKNWETDLVD